MLPPLNSWPKFIALSLIMVFFSAPLKGIELDFGYDSRYVSEGRNNLDNGGITWLQMAQQLNASVSVVGLYGEGHDYDEFNLGLVYAQSLADVDYYLSLTHLRFFEDEQKDTEVAMGLMYHFSQPFSLALDTTYSTQAKGTFVELSLATELSVKDNLSLNPYLKIGADFGYASNSQSGYNHTAFGTTINYQVTEKLAIYLIIEQSIASGNVQSQTNQKQQNWLGLHLTYSY